jgi:hypothetical protein
MTSDQESEATTANTVMVVPSTTTTNKEYAVRQLSKRRCQPLSPHAFT